MAHEATEGCASGGGLAPIENILETCKILKKNDLAPIEQNILIATSFVSINTTSSLSSMLSVKYPTLETPVVETRYEQGTPNFNKPQEKEDRVNQIGSNVRQLATKCERNSSIL